MSKLRVFLADDHAVVRQGLKALINAHPGMAVVGEAADGRTACELVERLCPGVAVLDVSMPEMNGGLATERIRQSCPGVKVLALTVHEDRGYLRQLLAAGAAGYVLKRSAAEDLIRAIEVVAGGGIYLDPALAGKVVGGFVHRPGGEAPAGEVLSEREAAAVRLTACGHGNKEIAARLDVSTKTVQTYKARALEKLGLHTRAELVRYAVGRGWLQRL
jgi:DNA-binding NarL/FixJ family response regulator